MINELIRKTDVLDLLNDLANDFGDNYELYSTLFDSVDGMEAANVEKLPKTGQWVEIMVGDMPAQACDCCGTFYPLAHTGGGYHYCPNCGADMRGGKNEI